MPCEHARRKGSFLESAGLTISGRENWSSVSAFEVAVKGKADVVRPFAMSAYDPKRTFPVSFKSRHRISDGIRDGVEMSL
jgi:hypothetical protein